ncbi:MAG: hypothetical protein EBY21_08830 [Alphaproteobacteria bacterium]|nr:hypothetical protein [Alphaproteobacteria bacterium]
MELPWLNSGAIEHRMVRRWFANRFLANLTALFIMAAALVGANFLQSDTSLQMVESTGVLRICVPASFPPLVSGAPKAPGFDVAVLEEKCRTLFELYNKRS